MPVYGVEIRAVAASPVFYYTPSPYFGHYWNMEEKQGRKSINPVCVSAVEGMLAKLSIYVPRRRLI